MERGYWVFNSKASSSILKMIGTHINKLFVLCTSALASYFRAVFSLQFSILCNLTLTVLERKWQLSLASSIAPLSSCQVQTQYTSPFCPFISFLNGGSCIRVVHGSFTDGAYTGLAFQVKLCRGRLYSSCFLVLPCRNCFFCACSLRQAYYASNFLFC